MQRRSGAHRSGARFRAFQRQLRVAPEEELDSLEAEANNAIEFREFVPAEKIDPVYFETSYYLAPTKGAEKPYRLLAETLEKPGALP